MQQLALADADLFADELTQDNFLRPALCMLVRNTIEPAASPQLRAAGLQLQEQMRERFRLNLYSEPVDEDDESAPVVLNGGDGAAARADSFELPAAATPGAGERERMGWMLQ